VTKWSHIMPAVDGTDRDDLVFKALADPTRRALLDALFDTDGQTVVALCDAIPR
jgi:DNA-binding transcriptional ArsR family regulator